MLERLFEIRRFALDFTPTSADPAVPSNRVVDRRGPLSTGVATARHVPIHVTACDDQAATSLSHLRPSRERN